MENNARLQLLISKYLDRSISKAEKVELLGYFDDPTFLVEIEERFGMEYEQEQGADKMNEIHQQQLLDHVFGYNINQAGKQTRKVKLWPLIGMTAAIATIIISAGIWFYKGNEKVTGKHNVYSADVAPGKSSATLTLASGRKIILTDAANGELTRVAGVVITKTADGQLIYQVKDESNPSKEINILSTAKGETYQVRLPDGTSVWLNAGSTLKYPASFAKLTNRQVELSGEGYFEVAKDRQHPFIVKTEGQEVTVLGTHFNINAYADEPVIATTLLEGSIKLKAGNNDKLLKPGEQALNNVGVVKVEKANIEAITDWKNEEFYLDKMDFRLAMRKIARWYNIEVIYSGAVPDNLVAGGWIPRNNKLSDVLKAIELTGQVKFKIEGKKLYVSK